MKDTSIVHLVSSYLAAFNIQQSSILFSIIIKFFQNIQNFLKKSNYKPRNFIILKGLSLNIMAS